MNLLSAENISKKFGDRILFEGLTIGLNKGDKVSLIAPNGTGKTSLLKILGGVENPDSGLVVCKNGIKVEILEQEPKINPHKDVLENIFDVSTPMGKAVVSYKKSMESGNQDLIQQSFELMDMHQAWDFESKASQLLHKFKIDDIKTLAGSLSGGQRRRLALARMILNEPDLMLLDEPTNHLDIEMIEWLENYLSSGSFTMLMITHDRYFLNKICNKILEIDEGKLFQYQGNYEYFLEKREERYNVIAAGIGKAKNLYSKELEWIRKQPKARGTKSKARIEAFDDLSNRAHQKISDRQLQFGNKISRLGNKVIETYNLGASYPNKGWLFRNFNYKFLPGERVGIIGNNGSGKSTLIKTLLKIRKPEEGRIEMGETVVVGYFGQEELVYKPGQRIIELIKDIAEQFELNQGQSLNASQLLEKFLFPKHTHYTLIDNLSGGEKRRLYLLTVLLKNPNVLVLDEPTNDLDIMTLNVLEDYLYNFSGTIIIISHDRYFIDKVVDHIFVFEGTTDLKDFPGNYFQYTEYLLTQSNDEKPENKKIQAPESIVIEKTTEKKKPSFKEKLEFEKLGIAIQSLEKEKDELSNILSSNESDHNKLQEIGARLAVIQQELEESELRWLELSEWFN